MKKFCKVTVPVVLALVLLFIPAGAVFADETETAPTTETTEAAVPETPANQVWPVAPEVDTESVLVIENSKSLVFYEKAADELRYPASTTKIMTALLAIENCDLNELVTFTESAITLEEAATNIQAVAGEQMPMRDVLYGLMLASGNDCANAIAEHVAGSVPAFAEMMNARAAEIGCTNTHFSNPHGLFAEDHYTTARDMALIAQEAYKNTTFLDIISTQTYTAAPTNTDPDTKTFKNWNLLLDPESEYYDPDVIGGKTGYLDESKRCLVTFAKRDGFTIITVLLKGGYTEIFNETKTLLDFTFNHFTMKNVSANENRFAIPVENAKVVLDPSSQILALNAIPFDQLNSNLILATDLDLERRAEIQTSGVEDGRTLFAVIDYSYADHPLGSVNVYLDPTIEIAPAAFTSVYYIKPLYIVIFVVIVLILILSLYGSRKNKKPAKRTQPVRRRS